MTGYFIRTELYHWKERAQLTAILAVIFGLFAGHLQAAGLIWDTVSGDSGTITDGSGTWMDGGTNWNTGSGDTTWNNASAYSAIIGTGGVAGTITITNNIIVNGLTFNPVDDNYTIAGEGGTLIPAIGSVITVNDDAAIIRSVISGSAVVSNAGTGMLIFAGTNKYTGGTVISTGTLCIKNTEGLGSGTVTLNGGTLLFDTAGLYEGRVANTFDAPNPNTTVQLHTPLANIVSGNVFGTNTTAIYTGFIRNSSGSSTNWTFAENFDDRARLTIDGCRLFDDGGWDTITVTNCTLTPGEHSFEVRLYNGGGDGGPNSHGWTIGFGYDSLARGTTDSLNYAELVDPGDGSLLCHDIRCTNNIILSNVLGNGISVIGTRYPIMSGTLSGPGGFIKSGPGTIVLFGTNTYAGGTKIIAGKVCVDHFAGLGFGSVTLNGGTLSFNKAGLYEGKLTGNFNETEPNPKTAVELGTPMAHVVDEYVFGTDTTWIYTGFIRNNASTNVTWTFAEQFDDNVLLKINGTVLFRNQSWDTPTAANCILAPGMNSLELRVGNGAGSSGPHAGGWAIGLGYDTLARGTTDPANYVALTDPGDGSMLCRDNEVITFTNNIVLSSMSSNGIEVTGAGVSLLGELSGPGGFTKLGAGILTMVDAKKYTGNTAVQDGMLVLSNAFLNANADVYLYSPAKISLNFTGNNVIHYLYINGVKQPLGMYNSGNLSSFISGEGSLLSANRGLMITIR
jgi:autotransporter-associated beta strand protein